MLYEATSYMDTENESIVQEAISNLVKGKTLILIAHRLRTVVNADKIFVVENGKIESCGKHEELLETSKVYSSLWKAAGKEERYDYSILENMELCGKGTIEYTKVHYCRLPLCGV